MHTNPTPDVTTRWVLISTITASSMGFISGSALNVALPALQAALQIDAADMLWITSGYLMLLASLILVGGSLGDHYGRKRIFGYGIVLFIGASVACGFAQNAPVLIAARMVQGVGGALMVPGSLAIIAAYFDDQSRGGAIGLWSAFTSAATVGAPVLGGYLASVGLWRGVFFINVPLALIALYALRFVPESKDDSQNTPLDIVGAVLATLGLAGISYGFIEAGRAGFNAGNLGVLAVGLLLAGVFVWWEQRTPHPMMPLALFRSPVFAGTNLLTVLLYAGLQGCLFFFSLNLIQAQGYREDAAGLAMMPFSLLLIVMSRQSGRLADRIGARLPLTLGALVTGAGFALLGVPSLTAGAGAYWTTYFPAIVLIGLGMGVLVAPLTSAVMGSVPKHNSGTASGINNAASRTAGVLAIAIMGTLMLFQFSQTLTARGAALELPADVLAALTANANELGNTQIPADVPAEQQDALTLAIRLSFVDAFRTTAWISAGMAWLSAIVAWVMLRPVEIPARE